ncbi:MAG: hypothetical protein IPP48_14870 [Chitinophagaceae bacterium]|nr:hypothetical protein [Chitinophagaceae bacterium]
MYLTTERSKKILVYNVAGAVPVATNIVYGVSNTANGGSAGITALGYHGIYVSRDGTTFYTGRSGSMVAQTDRALRFTRQTVANSPSSAASIL